MARCEREIQGCLAAPATNRELKNAERQRATANAAVQAITAGARRGLLR